MNIKAYQNKSRYFLTESSLYQYVPIADVESTHR